MTFSRDDTLNNNDVSSEGDEHKPEPGSTSTGDSPYIPKSLWADNGQEFTDASIAQMGCVLPLPDLQNSRWEFVNTYHLRRQTNEFDDG